MNRFTEEELKEIRLEMQELSDEEMLESVKFFRETLCDHEAEMLKQIEQEYIYIKWFRKKYHPGIRTEFA